MMKKIGVLLMAIILVVFLPLGCSQKSDPTSEKKSTKKVRKELLKLAIQTAKTIAPKDAETPPEQGGYGFEKIAEKLGFQTYVPTPEDLKFFGDPRAVKGGVLTTITSRFPATMRTVGKNSNYTENYTFGPMLYEGMLDRHPVTLEYMPRLASHWKISDDKMHFTFRINPDARWSDGKPVTTEDVIITWLLHMDETILAPSDQLTYGKFEKPVAESKYIISIQSKELNWRNFLYFSASMSLLPAHRIKGLSGTDYLKEYQFQVLPGTGPYTILKEEIKNQLSYAVTRRLDYWDADNPVRKYKYNYDKIKWLVVKDNRTLEFEKFKKGEQDYYWLTQARRWVEDTEFESIKKGWILKRKIFSEKPAGTSGYAFNMRKPPFDDRNMRYAFTYLLNREKMIKELFFNEYILQDSLYAGSVYENPDNEKIKYNPDKAVALLKKAGWAKRNEKGLLINDDGQVLRLELGIPKVIDYVVTPYQQMLRDYGIDLQLKFMDGNTLWKMEMERKFELTYMNWGGLVSPNPETSYHSKLADTTYNNNIYGFKHPRVDELCEIYDKEFDRKKRIEIIREIDGIVMDVRPMIITHHAPFERLLFWNKFGYPEYMVERYTGDYRNIYDLWWFDPEKVERLYQAMEKDETLPRGETKVFFWPDYLKKKKELAEVSAS